jgi:hypothetical protein
MIAIICPTRGLIFTEVLESIESVRLFHDAKIYYSYSLGIPDSFNQLVSLAIAEEEMLGYKLTHLFFIEEDTVPPIDALDKLLCLDSDIAFFDYGVNGVSCSARDSKTGKILWAGLGCTLVKREVFNKVKYPWFRDDKALRLNDWTWINTNPDKVYGGHDIWFYTKSREAGFSIEQARGECKHLMLKELGRPEVNKGLHIIKKKLQIKKYQKIKGGDLDGQL